MRWLKHNQSLRYEWYVETVSNGEHLKFDGITNAVYYCGVIRSFREYVEQEVFQEIAGMKFSKYLIEYEKPGL
jgi:tartrate dehydratase beta subunit/fumarate hydratase class I family protein